MTEEKKVITKTTYHCDYCGKKIEKGRKKVMDTFDFHQECLLEFRNSKYWKTRDTLLNYLDSSCNSPLIRDYLKCLDTKEYVVFIHAEEDGCNIVATNDLEEAEFSIKNAIEGSGQYECMYPAYIMIGGILHTISWSISLSYKIDTN